MRGRLVARAGLSAAEREAMLALLGTQFLDVRREVFLADLDGKNWVLLLEAPDCGRLLGFTTLDHRRLRHCGRDLQVVFSGDTVIAAEAAGSRALCSHWMGAVNHLRGADPAPLYWLLIVSGFRTYRFMPIFWREYHPRHDAPAQPQMRELADALAGGRFGARYDPATGIVRLAAPQVLRPELRGIPVNRLADPHVAYFARRNPGHERGDELVCLAEVSWENATVPGRRMWEAGERLFGDSVRAR